MAGRASIVGAAETSVGKVRDHNEDSHFIDPEAGIFVVCDGMGGHAAGEVASDLAVKTIRKNWSNDVTQAACDLWLDRGTPDARKKLLQVVQQGVLAAHDAIVAEADADANKKGMGTTLVGAIVVGGDIVFAHAGDSRAYMVRDGIAMQLTEDHTLLARLLAAGVEVDVDGEGMRFKSMLTNALGIGHECKVSTFVVPLADGDRFLLCSDGITEYLSEPEIGEVLTTQPSPARSAQRLVELALQRGGGDNATALVVRVLEAGETARPAELLKREQQAINACPIWGRANPQQRLRALRIALPRDYALNDKLPAQTLGDRVAWIVVEGELEQDGHLRGPGSLLYPEALLADRPLPDKDGLAVAQSEIRALAIRADDFRELCDDDPELGEILLSSLAAEIALRRPQRRTGKMVVQADSFDGQGSTDPGEIAQADTGELPALKRAKSNTDRGSPAADRAPAPPTAAAPAPVERPSMPRMHPRGSTPPTGLIVPATERADADEALDRALSEISGEREPVAKPAPQPVTSNDDSQPEITVEAAAEEPAPGLSEPEIRIEELEDAAAHDEPEEAAAHDEPEEMVMTVEDDSARVAAVLEELEEPSEPEIIVEPLVAADSGRAAVPAPRAKSESET